MSKGQGTVAAVAVLAALTVIAYGAALQNGYVWDDRFFFTDFKIVEGGAQAWRAAFEPLFGQTHYVRPLPLLLLYAENILGRHQATLPHAVNLVLHLACALMVFLLARRAMDRAMAPSEGWRGWVLPLLLAAVFTVHPALSEAVLWVASRFDLMASLFMLLALYAWTSNLSAWPKALLVALCFFLGALSKESVVVLPVVLFVVSMVDRAAQERSRPSLSSALGRPELLGYACILLAGVAYLAIRFWVLSGADPLATGADSVIARLLRFGMSVSKYLQLSFLPFAGLSPQHTFATGEGGLPILTSWLPILVAVVLVFTVIMAALRRNVIGLVLLAWLLAYGPVLHILPLQLNGNLVHQRFMYFPTALLLALAPYALAHVPVSSAGRRLLWWCGGAAVLVSVMLVRSIVPMWQSDLTLWEWTTRADPKSTLARENLIWSYVNADRLEDAEAQLDVMRQLGMKIGARPAINIGTAYYNRGKYEEALRFYTAALTTRLNMPPLLRASVFSNVAMTHAMLGHVDQARTFVERGLSEKEYGTNQVAVYLAFCKGESRRLDEFGPDLVRQALPTVSGATKMLVTHQPVLYRSGAFCPETDVTAF
ncbi:MAG: tetratricopeptide repeat protein [Pseudoxanthomonas sp.]|nr:tetratricopeptide repeat protein [Pseudoxanthomonas sp.]